MNNGLLYFAIRSRTRELIEPRPDEDCAIASKARRVKWHMVILSYLGRLDGA